MFIETNQVRNQIIPLEVFSISNFNLVIKREDQLHPDISGNKLRKLKYNILEAKRLNKTTLLTFGGAYSNHIAAVASLGKEYGFKTIGIIRGEELVNKVSINATLSFAKSCGMFFYFISRAEYRKKNELFFLENLKSIYGDFYLLPEGGTNDFAVKGCAEILTNKDTSFDYVCSSVGTGGTLAGLIMSSNSLQTVIGFSALKGTFQTSYINKFTRKKNYRILDDYCFGGYAKINFELIEFINDFKNKTTVSLDPIYTGKMIFGIFDLINKGYFKENSTILAVHTGGLQGINGMNALLKKKNLPTII
ncbi:pyridoxal-phosphate dependent enzyme [Flavobacteriaceae bacterium]|nr:pyridoxal-phosphate dependent enzyme [Flavobacteriaceae bacterium]